MIELLADATLALSALVGAALLLKNDPNQAKKVFSITFVLVAAVGVCFSLAQLCAMAGLFVYAPAYSPVEFLALTGVVFWVSFVTARGTMFDRMLGK